MEKSTEADPFPGYFSESSHGTIAALKLLERPAEEAYINAWTDLIAQEKVEEAPIIERSIMIFCLDKGWFALPTTVLSEIIPSQKIHTIPHCQSNILLGMVNLHGQLTSCFNMAALLGIKHHDIPYQPNITEGDYRMLAIQKNNKSWIFPITAVVGLYHCDLELLKNVPITAEKSTSNYLIGMIEYNGKNVGILDEELVFSRLERSFL